MEPEIIAQIIRDVVATIAAGTAATVAIIGLSTWKTQYKKKIYHEEARKLLKALYRSRDMVNSIRSPFISAGEFVEAREDAGEEGQSNKAPGTTDKDIALVYQRRWKVATDAFREFETELIEAEVLWGDPAKEAASDFKQCLVELRVNIEMYLRTKVGRWWERPQVQIQTEKYEKVIYKMSDDPDKDEFSGKVNDAVAQLETYLRKHLEL